jgi:hypothetical protein
MVVITKLKVCKVWNNHKDQMKEATRMASRLAEENRLLKPEVQSLQATVAEGRQQDLARV